VADTCVGTRALGPGLRSVVWVQGCPFSCPGCIAPEWIPQRTGRLVTPGVLADELLADDAVTGLTISGGEPMLQAAALAELVQVARQRRSLSVICYTGFTLEQLTRSPRYRPLLEHVDVLIDGKYEEDANDGRGLRGSSNQRVHHLTDRLAGHDFTDKERRAEIRVRTTEMMLVGIPPHGMADALDVAMARLRDKEWR
jgi:anaerobic ribonucleoside-triphosphate reductase activating protein